MSNTKPSDVKDAHVGADTTPEAWRHILDDELNRVLAFKDDPAHTPTADFPQVRWVQLGTSKLWVSPGELSALGDYLPDPESIDTMSAKALIPVLQRMRQTIARSIAYRLEYGDTNRERNRLTRMKGAAGLDPETATFHNPLRDISEDAAEVNDLDEATSSLGSQPPEGAPRAQRLPLRAVLLGAVVAVPQRGAQPREGRARDEGQDEPAHARAPAHEGGGAEGVDRQQLREPLPPGQLRGRAPHQQDPRHAVVRRVHQGPGLVGQAALRPPREGRARRHDREGPTRHRQPEDVQATRGSTPRRARIAPAAGS